MREMRAIAFVTTLIQEGKVDRGEMKEMLIHSIRSDQTMAGLGVSSKFKVDGQADQDGIRTFKVGQSR